MIRMIDLLEDAVVVYHLIRLPERHVHVVRKSANKIKRRFALKDGIVLAK